MHPLLLDVETAARQLGVSEMTFRRRLAAGEVVGSKIGSQWRFWAPVIRDRIAAGHPLNDPPSGSPQ